MNEAKKLVPKLRFPEFRGEWESKNLGSVARLRNGYAFKSAEYVDDGPYQIITIANVQQGNLLIESTKRMAALPPDIQQHQVLSLEDILISMTGNVGRVCHVTDEGLLLNQRVGKLVPIEIDAAFFYQLLQRDEFRNSMQLKAAGGAQGNLSAGDITEYAFSVPVEPSEQQKIADCLSSLDELIAAQARKVNALKTHKKGLMQQLFPREGETQPRLRFPEFRNEGAWSKRKLSDFIAERNQFPQEKVPLYSLTIEDGVTPKTARYERSFLVSDETEAYKLVLPNDFAFNPMNLRFGAIGKHSGTEKVAVSKYYNIFYCDDSVDSRFCEIYFRSDSMVRFYDTMAIGSLLEKRRVHFSDFLKFSIRFPKLFEQRRIADCLSSLDDLINAAIQELATLKTHKKGLMQQLFPSAAELAA